jgi:hypothetical protein
MLIAAVRQTTLQHSQLAWDGCMAWLTLTVVTVVHMM